MICILISAIIAFVKSVLIVMYNVMCLECIQSCVCVCMCVCACVCVCVCGFALVCVGLREFARVCLGLCVHASVINNHGICEKCEYTSGYRLFVPL